VKVPLSWLHEFCPTDLDAEDLADRLNVAGVHVEKILRPWSGLSGVIVARVKEKRAHPKSEKLTLATLETGSGEAHVAAGVANWEPGDLVPYAPPGARVPVLDVPLGVKLMGGEESQGMICSPHELGISADHGAILILPSDLSPGADVAAALGLDDMVLDVEVEPNRPDLMSVLGVAREASSATGTKLLVPDPMLDEAMEAAADVATVEVVDPQRCPRYLARVVRGVGDAASPLRVQARLTAAGMRPVSAVVDATNYVMLELGQPMHPFDLDQLDDHAIVVRRASQGERLETLDGVDRVLDGEDLVIADRSVAVGIAGVMGSARAEVSPTTTDILLESAYFERKGILFTARRLHLSTEASMRFERGADPEGIGLAADRAVALMTAWAAGTPLRGAIVVGEAPPRVRVPARPSRVSRYLDVSIGTADIRQAFDRLGITTEETGDDEVVVEAPGYRPDLRIEEDVIEEVARLLGYDSLPSTIPRVPQSGGVASTYAFRRRLRDALVRAGLRETLSLPFVSREEVRLAGDDPGHAVRLLNPVEGDRPHLRTSLLPGLLRALQVNAAHRVDRAALFEAGHVFAVGSEGVRETERAAAAMMGPSHSGHPGDRRPVDFFDGTGALEATMGVLGVRAWRLGEPAGWPFHPGRSAVIRIGDEEAGVVGELHPRATEQLELPGRVVAFELDADTVSRHVARDISVEDVPRFPPAVRDLAFVVDASVPAAEVARAIREAGTLVYGAELFDAFSGSPLPEGRKNLAYTVEFRTDRTLTNEEVDEAVAAIAALVGERVGGEFRAG
jgi:phenylalanyl-tRNA synthetase beta chain